MKIQSYEILSTLGAGGMGTVYKARHILTNEVRAIKSLSKNLCFDPAIRQRFINEALIMSKLDHPNIVKVYDLLEERDELHIVMEYVEGETLNKIIGEKIGPIPYQKALPLFNQIAEGIAYAHSKEVIHRDIKPSNIMLTPQNIIKITDFGIAKANDIGGATKTGTKMGTLMYMSPEQIEGQHADKSADIYSLGMTLYEMLAGKLPFTTEDRTSDLKIMRTITEKELPLPTKFYPHIPENIVSAVMKSLSKQSENRFQSVNEFRKCVNDESTELETPYPSLKPKPSQEKLIPSAIEHNPEQKRKRNKKRIIISAVIVYLVLGLGYALINSGSCTDQDGNTFKTVKIGSQVWSAENLNVEHYRNGDAIPQVQDKNEWERLHTGAWCYYENKSENGKKYGKLYNWYAVNDRRGLAPKGWHIPTKEEFETLMSSVNGNSNSLKAEGEGTGAGAGNNSSGFSALFSGYRSIIGDFTNLGGNPFFWSSTEYDEAVAYYMFLSYGDSSFSVYDYDGGGGLSVRVVKD